MFHRQFSQFSPFSPPCLLERPGKSETSCWVQAIWKIHWSIGDHPKYPKYKYMNIYIYIDLYNCNFIIPNMSQYGWTLTTLVVTWFQNSGWNVSSWIGFHQLLCLLFWGPNLTDAYVRRMGSLSAPFRVHTGILKTTTITILFNHKADHETHIDILHTLQSMNTMYICRYMMVYDGISWYMMAYDGIYRRYMYDLCIEKQKTLMHHTSSSHDKLQRAAKWPMPREYWTTPAIDVSIRCRWSLDFEVLNGTN